MISSAIAPRPQVRNAPASLHPYLIDTGHHAQCMAVPMRCRDSRRTLLAGMVSPVRQQRACAIPDIHSLAENPIACLKPLVRRPSSRLRVMRAQPDEARYIRCVAGYITPEPFALEAQSLLGDFVRQSGCILYSSATTLRPGAVYLIGLNPGVDPDGLDDPDIQAHIKNLPSKGSNSYIDAEWDRGRPGQDKFQRRVVWLLQSLGYNPREVCASNLIFRRSSGEADCGYPETAHRC